MSEQEERGPRVYSAVTDKVGFGKYRDLTLEELNNQDPGYLKWSVSNDAVDAACIQALIGEVVEPKKLIYLDSKIWFGKYKGRVFGEICSEDRDYAEYVLGEEGFLEYSEGNDPSNAAQASEAQETVPAPATAPSIPPTV